MIVRKNLDPRIIVRVAWKRVLSLAVVSTFVYMAERNGWLAGLTLSTVPGSILGTALSILIGFRVNNAYERWWEARRIWGAFVNDSRSFARQVLAFVSPHWSQGSEDVDVTAKRLVHGQMGFVHALRCHLRRQDVAAAAAPFFSAEELAHLRTRRNVPNAILELQAQRLRNAFERKHTEDFRHMQMDTTLNRLCDSMGACERIKNTVFPRQYSFYSSLFTAVFTYLLPLFLVREVGVLIIPLSVVIGFIFFALDTIAKGIENPFENTFNDTPMTAICTAIEADLRQMLGETELPEPVQPINGFLN